MLAKMVVVVGFLGLSSSLLLGGVSPAEAAGYAGSTGYATQAKRPQFRPWQTRSQNRNQDRWRPNGVSSLPRYSARFGAGSRQPALLNRESRYIPPAGRSFAHPASAGARFRPHGHLTVGVDPAGFNPVPQQERVRRPMGLASQSQFRPRPSWKRQTYEQLQSTAVQRPNWTSRTYAGAADPGGGTGIVPTSRASYWRTGR